MIELASLGRATMDSNEAGRPPISHPRRRQDGSWYVDVLWHNGRREQIGHFKTALEANEFIKVQLEAWHEGRKGKPSKRLLWLKVGQRVVLYGLVSEGICLNAAAVGLRT